LERGGRNGIFEDEDEDEVSLTAWTDVLGVGISRSNTTIAGKPLHIRIGAYVSMPIVSLFGTSDIPSSQAHNLPPTSWQLAPQHRSRPRPPIHALIPIRLVRQLINVQVHISILADTRAIGPDDPGVPHKRLRESRGRVVRVHGIVLGYQLVDESVAIPLEAVCVPAALAVTRDVSGGANLSQAIALAQIPRRDRVQIVRRQRRVVHGAPIGAQLQAVQPLAERLHGRPDAALVKRHALVARHVAVDTQRTRVLRQAPPALARAQIQHDEARPPLVAAVHNVRDPLARRRELGAQIEADVVHVRVRKVHGCGERVRLVHAVVPQIHGDDLGPARLRIRHRRRAVAREHRRAPGVDDPQRLRAPRDRRRDVQRLHANQARRVAAAKGDAVPGRVERGGGQVERCGWVGGFGRLVDDFAEREGVGAACVRHEEAARRGDGEANGPLRVVVVVLLECGAVYAGVGAEGGVGRVLVGLLCEDCAAEEQTGQEGG
jgi:hypothetical protein